MNIGATAKYKKSCKRSWKGPFIGDIFANVNWNYSHQKPETNPETWYVNEKVLIYTDILYTVEKDLKRFN